MRVRSGAIVGAGRSSKTAIRFPFDGLNSRSACISNYLELEGARTMKFAPHRKTRDDARRASKLLKIAAWAGVCLIAYATVSPLEHKPTLLISSKHEHLAAFAVLGALFCLAYPRRTPAVLIVAIGGAALLEVLQLLTPDRHARIPDALQKIAGGAAGVVAIRAILYLDRARSWFQV
jgi:VanZ family protein